MFIAKMTVDGNPPGSRQDMWLSDGSTLSWTEGPSPFTERVEFTFDPNVNVFIGPNASGKSTLLQQVLDNYRREWAYGNLDNTSEPEWSHINNQPLPVRLASSEHCVFALEDHDNDDHRNIREDMIIIPATRVRYGKVPEKDRPIASSDSHVFFGVESLSEVLYLDYIHSAISALQRMVQGNPIEDDVLPEDRAYPDWELLGTAVTATAEGNPHKAGRGLNEALAIAHECAKKICREVVLGDRPQNARIIRNVESESELPAAEGSVAI